MFKNRKKTLGCKARKPTARVLTLVLFLTLVPELGLSGCVRAASLSVKETGKMAVDRAAHQATRLLDGRVLITGGCSGPGCDRVLSSVEIYDPAKNVFTAVSSMRTPRASHTAVLLPNGNVLVSGGWTGRRASYSSEVFESSTGTWKPAGDMTVGRASHIAVRLRDGRLLMMGGGGGRLGDLDSAEVFHPSTRTFSAVGKMRSNHYLATSLRDGRVLVTGGQDSKGRITGSAEIFDPTKNAFEPTGSMSVPRIKHAAVLLADGRVMIFGGSDLRGYSDRFSSTEFFDPETGKFTAGPRMSFARHKLRDAVSALPNGLIVVAGGAARPEYFDPKRNAFTTVEGSLGGAQMFATATLLRNGRILVTGGYNANIRPSASAWLIGASE